MQMKFLIEKHFFEKGCSSFVLFLFLFHFLCLIEIWHFRQELELFLFSILLQNISEKYNLETNINPKGSVGNTYSMKLLCVFE